MRTQVNLRVRNLEPCSILISSDEHLFPDGLMHMYICMQGFLADTIDEAAEEILKVLKKSISSRDNVFYFDGWDGLGASAVLRAVARRLTAASPAGAGPQFEQVIHIDCSKWESRRALQRAVAEQLDLPAEVMEMFDRQDEEDDFRGVSQGSRVELQQIFREMQKHVLTSRRLLVIFHNGSSEEIDLASCCGFPLAGYSTCKVLWTFQGRLRVKPRMKVDTAMKSAGKTDVFFSPFLRKEKTEDLWSYLILQEAAEVVAACKVKSGFHGIIDEPAQVAECFQYMLELCCRGSQWIDYDLNTHGANYWVCDGIVRQPQRGERNVSVGDAVDGLWRSAEALQREMPLDVDYHQYLPSPHLLARFLESKPYWSSPTCGFTWIPDGETPHNYYDKLSVLKLSGCSFDMQSPPFLSCHSIKFLWLDHCQINETNTTYGAGMEWDFRRFFQRLWVLEVRYTSCDQILSAQMLDLMTQLRELNVMGAQDWDMGQLQGRLPNIRKLRVTKSTVSCSSCSENDLLSDMNKMELLEFSGNKYAGTMTSLCGPRAINNSSCLETVIIANGCYLKQISFRGCTELKNILLNGWMNFLRTLDISGTAVKTLDLTATIIQYLDELYLLGCKKLCAILWPPENKRQSDLAKLCIGTTQTTPTAQYRKEEDNRPRATGTSAAALVLHSDRPTSEFDWYISVRDARLLASLEPVYSSSCDAYVEVSSPTTAACGSKDEEIRSGSSNHEQLNLPRHPAAPIVYADITVDNLQQQASEDNDDAGGMMWMWPCPDVPPLPQESCYMHIQDQTTRTGLSLPRGGKQTSGTTITVKRFVPDCAKILHVHDSLSITSTPSNREYGSEWPNLEWCRIERCPNLDFVFHNVEGYDHDYQLRTFWASQLLKSRYISKLPRRGYRVFPDLTFLHLDLCPRLIHVLPTWKDDENMLRQLETLEIVWCGDLREIFPLHTYNHEPLQTHIDKPITREFTALKHIHLHELPSLQSICGARMRTPNLETVKIRGCWSLTRLPDVGSGDKVVECDCEKDWWDRLEWDDGSQASRYMPIHSRYYKKNLLRGSVLR
ncbi:unnamed protein product [Urochloa decumbens]|uniref:Disease resistance protein At4g27190-like leucine-rich repeats domain-containing protein n=1 Tax=Urochloa decumbens TaxID=240449 RepID=A0ABC9HBB6_9POAL